MAIMSKKEGIRKVQQDIGWAYSDMKWLTDKEAGPASQKRERLIKILSNKTKYSFMQNKLHTGRLSPGCLICGQGSWSCMFINGLCTANCFYCPQDRGIKKERSPYAEGVAFDNAKDYIDYIERFNIKGVGFSGGEPMLVLPKLLEFIEKIRKRFGKVFYLWLYTNGDLVDRNKLNQLKKAGLDEIRFDISARDYDLKPVGLAVDIIKSVAVEIPAIPEDYEKVKNCLARMKRLGVKYLNIHQLLANRFNYKNYIKRDYTFLHHLGFLPIFESEITALKLIGFALEHKLNLPINYCSQAYKDRLQGRGKALRVASLITEVLEEITGIGYIRQLSLQDSPANIKKFIRILQENNCPKGGWFLNDSETEIFIHSSLLKYKTFGEGNLAVAYFKPEFKTCFCLQCAHEPYKEITLNSHKKVYVKREVVIQNKLTSLAAMRSFQKLFIENIEEKIVLGDFFKNYKSRTKVGFATMKKELEALMAFKKCEHLESGWPEIY
ncbi:MAG: radical SAM protein [Candidatus Omnitrophota bacterium]|nr:radical SAM protein [Candidatus Omnitrophota bacterium]